MFTNFDGYGRPVRQPTLMDYEKLQRAYQKLRADHEAVIAQLASQRATTERQERGIARLEQTVTALQQELEQERRRPTQQEREHEEAGPSPATEPAAGEQEDWRGRYLRLQAEMDNYKKRQERRFAQVAAEDRQRILQDMLPLADHLELGLQHLREDPQAQSDPRLRSYLENLESTRRAFLEALRRHGVEKLSAHGEAFDPKFHEAVGHVHAAEVPEDHVARVVQSGYRDRERLLRPARVLLSSGTPDREARTAS